MRREVRGGASCELLVDTSVFEFIGFSRNYLGDLRPASNATKNENSSLEPLPGCGASWLTSSRVSTTIAYLLAGPDGTTKPRNERIRSTRSLRRLVVADSAGYDDYQSYRS